MYLIQAMRKLILTISCVLITAISVKAEYYFSISPGIEELYYSAWEMNFEEAYETSEKVKTAEPENLLVYHVENYIDFLRIFVADDVRDYDQFNEDFERRLKMIQEGDDSSPYFYYSQAELYLQRSLIRAKNEEPIRAGWDLNRANKLLKNCKKRYPNFRYVDKSLALIHTLMGSVKGFKKSMLKLFTSLDGTIDMGLVEIDNLFTFDQEHPSLWSAEIASVRSMIQGHLMKDWKASYATIQSISDFEKNLPLGRFLVGSIASKAGFNDEAITWLTKNHDQHSFSLLDYLGGSALLNNQDQKASFYLERFIDHHQGQNLLKAAHHKLAWYALVINEDVDEYFDYLKIIRTTGSLDTAEDHEAMAVAEAMIIPDQVLIKTRLLFDGGYYRQAKVEILKFNPFNKSAIQIKESIYRKARICHKLEEFDEALELYAHILDHPSKEDQYFSCNASLQMAQIYYDQASYSSAQKYVDVTLGIHPTTHKKSLHQEARLLKELITADQ